MDIKMIGKVARNRLIQDLFSAFQKQLNLSEEEISKFRYEAFLVESNEEQILKWEEFMNLEEKPDYSLQDRIDRVLFTLQSRGSFTPDFLKEQAKIFMNGIIDIEELFNEYSFTLVFKDIVGVPPNLENFRAMLELNKPAHLTYKFKFRYNTHGQLEVLTHGEMEQYTHDELYQKRVFEDSQLPDGTPIVRTARFLKSIVTLIFPLKTDYYNVDIFNDNFKYLDEHKLEKGGYTGTAQNLLTEISKIASKSVLGRIIIGKGISVDSFGRTSVVSKNDGIIVNENDIQLDTVDNVTTDSGTKPLSARQGKKLDENKQNKNDNTLKTTAKNIVGAINELFIELWKTGSTTQFGRFKVGKNLSVDEDGFLNGNPQYTHPAGNGNSHLPSGGATGQFIKWLSAGVGQWASITWSDITGKPSSFTPSSHKHTKAEITDFAHTHPEYITSAQIEEKFKIFCPFPVGSVLPMWNENNPTTLYLGTTWELITAGKYIQSGSTPLSVGGNNSISITKANLPNIKLKVDSFSVTTQKHSHPVTSKGADGDGGWDGTMFSFTPYGNSSSKTLYTDNAGGQNTGIASPNTEVLGSGTALNIQPAYITLKFWKRLT